MDIMDLWNGECVEDMVAQFLELPSIPEEDPEPVKRTQRTLFVATPCFGCKVTNVYATSVMMLKAECAKRGVGVQFEFIGNESLVERARNILTAMFLKSDATHLLFIDADIGFDPESVFRLLDSDKGVVGGVYPKKSIDWGLVQSKTAAGSDEPAHQMGLDFNINIAKNETMEDGFVRVLDTATGFLLIRRDVIERMNEAYRDELFAVNDIQGKSVKDYVALFACMIDPTSKRFLSEDYAFCRRYQQIGGEIWACTRTPLSHVGTTHLTGDIRERMVTVFRD